MEHDLLRIAWLPLHHVGMCLGEARTIVEHHFDDLARVSCTGHKVRAPRPGARGWCSGEESNLHDHDGSPASETGAST